MSDDRKSGFSDIMRKAVAAGLGAVFLTEESLRGYVAEAKIPRDIAKYLLQQSGAAKEQLAQYLSKEVGQLVRRTDLAGLLAKIMENHEIEVEAKIRFKPTGGLEVRDLHGNARAIRKTEDVGLSDDAFPEDEIDLGLSDV